MKFPIIKIYDKNTGTERIVGTNTHDCLKVINNGESISYLNHQNGEGTGTHGAYSFTGEYCDHESISVEFISFEKLKEIYEMEQVSKQKSKDLLEKLMRGFD